MPADRRLAALGVLLAIPIFGIGFGEVVRPANATGHFTREVIAFGLDWPVSFAFAPDGRIFFSERFSGSIRVIVDGQLSLEAVGSVPVVTNGEQGLLGLALDPDFNTSPWVYVYHTYFSASLNRDANRVVRVSADPGSPRTEVVLDAIPAGTVHNGGILGFAADGTLFITTGDAQNVSNSQDPTSLAGKVLRVNRDGTVPTNNPFPGSPVFSLGHRNVFGLAFHPLTGLPYISENGPNQNDEVNRIEPARNYGWPIVTGDAGDPRFVDPVATYASVIAPTGLAFYTGEANATLRNDLFLGDWNRGILQRLELASPDFDQVIGTEEVDRFGAAGILDVETGPDGSIYVSTPDAIYRMSATGNPPNGLGGTGSLGLTSIAIIAGVLAVAVAVLGVRLFRGGRRRR